MADDVGYNDTSAMKFVNSTLGRSTEGADKEFGAFLDDDIDDFIELTFAVIVVGFAT